MVIKEEAQYLLIGTLNERNSMKCKSFASNNFHWNLLDFLNINNVLSINSVERVSTQGIEVRYLFTKYKLLYLIKSSVIFLGSYRGKSPIFYNLEWYTVHLFLLALLVNRRPRIIALDLSINEKLYKLLLYLSRNPIVLRKSFLLSNKQRHVLFPGFLTTNSLERDYTLTDRPLRSILCGSLGPNTGLREYCKLAERYSDIEFHITGVPHRISIIEVDRTIEEHNRHRNIFNHGSLDKESYSKLLSSCDFGFSLRSPISENMYNFPSKILEFISFGLVPISSIEYAEYTDFNIVKLERLPSLRQYKKLEIQSIAEQNLQVLKEYNRVERFF